MERDDLALRECRRIVFAALLWFHAGIVGVVLFELVIRRWFWP